MIADPFTPLGLETPPPDRPILIAGPTASGKSGLALRIAEAAGGVVVNADALQVYDGWHLLTARPSADDLARAPHRLYGHVPFDQPYSVGDWLRDIAPVLDGTSRPIIVGGTGLYLTALTEGLADIPAIAPEVREVADALSLDALIADLDPTTAGRIDRENRARAQRAWEVQSATGRSLLEWQRETAAMPLLPPEKALCLCLSAPRDWLSPRIARRFRNMIDAGLIDEARRMHSDWDPSHPSSKAIGASDLIAHLDGQIGIDMVTERAVIATRQYAKRQRTWFNKRMSDWNWIEAAAL